MKELRKRPHRKDVPKEPPPTNEQLAKRLAAAERRLDTLEGVPNPYFEKVAEGMKFKMEADKLNEGLRR